MDERRVVSGWHADRIPPACPVPRVGLYIVPALGGPEKNCGPPPPEYPGNTIRRLAGLRTASRSHSATGCRATIIQRSISSPRQPGTPSGFRAPQSALGRFNPPSLTLSFANRVVPLTEDEVERILAAFEVTQYVSAAALLRQVRAFHSWIEDRWPGVQPHSEIQVQSLLESGQVLNGQIDLLLKTEEGWILIDHKSSQLAPEHWDQVAVEYGAQIGAYAEAVEQASHRDVLESWIFLPIAGGALRLRLFEQSLTTFAEKEGTTIPMIVAHGLRS